MNLQKLVKEYLVECAMRNYSLETITQRSYALNRFIEYVENKDAEAISRSDVKSYLLQCKDTMKASTVNSLLRHLDGLFSYAADEGYIESNPCDTIKNLKEEKTVIRTYSSSTIQSILANLERMDFTSVRNKAIVTLLIETGIRNSEVCDIKLEDIADNCIKIHGKGNKIRFVPITDPFKEALDRYMFIRNSFLGDRECEYLFISRRGKGLTTQTLRKTIKENVFNGLDEIDGIATTVHNFRRFFAQNMLDNVDLYTVSRLMGHENINTTERYLRSAEASTIVARGMNSPLSKLYR